MRKKNKPSTIYQVILFIFDKDLLNIKFLFWIYWMLPPDVAHCDHWHKTGEAKVYWVFIFFNFLDILKFYYNNLKVSSNNLPKCGCPLIALFINMLYFPGNVFQDANTNVLEIPQNVNTKMCRDCPLLWSPVTSPGPGHILHNTGHDTNSMNTTNYPKLKTKRIFSCKINSI